MAPRREQIRWVLETLASEEEQLAYERAVPHVDVTAELVEQWFTDLFHRKQRREFWAFLHRSKNDGAWLQIDGCESH